MKRENFLLVTVTGCSCIDKKGVYKLGIKLGDQEKLLKWSKKSDSPEWNAGAYFAVSYDAAGSRKKGLQFKLYNKGFFGIKKLVATHNFDPGRITFYGCYNDWIDLQSTGKKPKLLCRLKVRVQYVRSTDYFTCPSCPRLDNHEPILFMGNIQSVSIEKVFKKGMHVELKCGKFKESTKPASDCEFNYHFMCEPSLLTAQEITATLYKKKKVMGSCKIKVDDVQEGNWCELNLPLMKSRKEVGKLCLLVQTLYECCDCIVEREDGNGDTDIPSKPIERAPAQQYSLQGSIPGMAPSQAVQPMQPMQPVQPMQPMQPVELPPAFPQVSQPQSIPVAIPVNQPYAPVATPVSSTSNVYMSIPGMSGY